MRTFRFEPGARRYVMTSEVVVKMQDDTIDTMMLSSATSSPGTTVGSGALQIVPGKSHGPTYLDRATKPCNEAQAND